MHCYCLYYARRDINDSSKCKIAQNKRYKKAIIALLSSIRQVFVSYLCTGANLHRNTYFQCNFFSLIFEHIFGIIFKVYIFNIILMILQYGHVYQARLIYCSLCRCANIQTYLYESKNILFSYGISKYFSELGNLLIYYIFFSGN